MDIKGEFYQTNWKRVINDIGFFTISVNEDDITFHSINESNDYYFRQYNIDKEYKMTVCSIKKNLHTGIEILAIIM